MLEIITWNWNLPLFFKRSFIKCFWVDSAGSRRFLRKNHIIGPFFQHPYVVPSNISDVSPSLRWGFADLESQTTRVMEIMAKSSNFNTWYDGTWWIYDMIRHDLMRSDGYIVHWDFWNFRFESDNISDKVFLIHPGLIRMLPHSNGAYNDRGLGSFPQGDLRGSDKYLTIGCFWKYPEKNGFWQETIVSFVSKTYKYAGTRLIFINYIWSTVSQKPQLFLTKTGWNFRDYWS